jgi:hypothetical protein
MSKALPDGTNAVSLDRPQPYLDQRATTIGGVLKQVFNNYFQPNMVDGVNNFFGYVTEVIEDPAKFENGSGYSTLNSATWLQKTLGQVFSSGMMQKRYKVRVLELDYCKTDPYACKESERKAVLETYKEFNLSPSENSTPVIGDVVVVTYGNLAQRKDGVILKVIGPNPTASELLNTPFGEIFKKFASLPGGFLGAITAPPPPAGPSPELIQTDVGIPINAAIRGNPLNPNPNLYAQVIDQFRVKTNPRYTVRDVNNDSKRDTFCNILVYDVTRAMGIQGGLYWLKGTVPDKGGTAEVWDPIPEADHDLTTKAKWKKEYWPTNAPRQYEWLRSNKGKKFGWKQVTPLQAQVAANAGFCVISGGHGHVTVIRPGVLRTSPDGFDDPKCSSAGGDNVDNVFNSNSFGKLGDVTYHVYVSPKAQTGFYEQKLQELKAIYLPLEQKITQLINTANGEKDAQKSYTLKKEIYDLTQKARSYGSLLARPTAPVAPAAPAAVASKPRPSKASKK